MPCQPPNFSEGPKETLRLASCPQHEPWKSSWLPLAPQRASSRLHKLFTCDSGWPRTLTCPGDVGKCSRRRFRFPPPPPPPHPGGHFSGDVFGCHDWHLAGRVESTHAAKHCIEQHSFPQNRSTLPPLVLTLRTPALKIHRPLFSQVSDF